MRKPYNEIVAEEYKRIREDPVYRLQEQMLDIEVGQIPSINQDPYTEEVQSYQNEVQEAEWSRKQWAYVQQLQGRVIHLENKLAELQAKKKQKEENEYLYK